MTYVYVQLRQWYHKLPMLYCKWCILFISCDIYCDLLSWQNTDIKNIKSPRKEKNMIDRCYMKTIIIHFNAARLLLRQLDMPLWVFEAINLLNLASVLIMRKHSIIRDINPSSMKRFVMRRNYNQLLHTWPLFSLKWQRKLYPYDKETIQKYVKGPNLLYHNYIKIVLSNEITFQNNLTDLDK